MSVAGCRGASPADHRGGRLRHLRHVRLRARALRRDGAHEERATRVPRGALQGPEREAKHGGGDDGPRRRASRRPAAGTHHRHHVPAARRRA